MPFDLAIQIERTVAQIYTQLAERFADNPDLRALFTLLREEELSHARRVEEVKKDYGTPPAGRWIFAMERQRFSDLLQSGETVLARLLDGGKITGEQAVQLAIRLEKEFSEVHAQALAQETNPKLVRLFEGLMQGDRAHLVLLERARASRRS